MSDSHKRKKEPLLNRQLIMDAAAEIGAHEGWQQVTFQAIADKAGMSKGGIVHHFKSKDELLDELLNQSLQELSEWISEEKQKNKQEDASIAYLRFVINKSNDEKHTRTMRIVIQAITNDEKYRPVWDEWYAKNIADGNPEAISLNSLIILLVADGLWYANTLGYYKVSDENKKKILKRMKDL